jgi:hypothetical protein
MNARVTRTKKKNVDFILPKEQSKKQGFSIIATVELTKILKV